MADRQRVTALYGPKIERDFARDPRRMMAEQMIAAGSSTAPVQSWQEGLARALQAGLGGWMIGKQRREREGREKAYSEGMMKALGAKGWEDPGTAVVSPQGDVTDTVIDEGRFSVSPAQARRNEMMRQGEINPDIAPEVIRMLQQQQAAEAAEEMRQRQRGERLEDAESLMELQRQYARPPVPVPGRDVPLSGDVFQQRLDLAAAGRPVWETRTDPVTGQSIQVNRKTGEEKASPTSKPMTEGQAKAATFTDRMRASHEILSKPELVEEALSLGERAAASVPIVGGFLTDPGYKLFEQAQRDFINAVLRQESGAAIAESEFENAKRQYFPTPGDTPEVIKQKAKSRMTAITGMSRQAGPSYQMAPAVNLDVSGEGGGAAPPPGFREIE